MSLSYKEIEQLIDQRVKYALNLHEVEALRARSDRTFKIVMIVNWTLAIAMVGVAIGSAL